MIIMTISAVIKSKGKIENQIVNEMLDEAGLNSWGLRAK